MPLPVRRMAPKPMRLTVRSPPSVIVPAAAAGMPCVVLLVAIGCSPVAGRTRSLHAYGMSQPFHFAFFVRDLASTRRFYGEVLGCREGRSTETWIDFDFFGNQISAHNSGAPAPTENTGRVDGVPVPMPHFSALLSWDAFRAVAGRIRTAGIPFILEPTVRYA